MKILIRAVKRCDDDAEKNSLSLLHHPRLVRRLERFLCSFHSLRAFPTFHPEQSELKYHDWINIISQRLATSETLDTLHGDAVEGGDGRSATWRCDSSAKPQKSSTAMNSSG